MPSLKYPCLLRLFALAVSLLMYVATSSAQSLNTIYSFAENSVGQPVAGLTLDAAGNLFGMTQASLSSDNSVVFELLRTSNGWIFSTLYTFQNQQDGEGPSTNLVMDAAGHLYGATSAGGSSPNCLGGCGTLFRLSPDGSGGWTKTTIYSFGAFPSDGAEPVGNLAMDAAGNVYGATAFGGVYGSGTAFVLKRQSNGAYRETILHHFGSTGASGRTPKGGVVLDSHGNVYGTLANGGLFNSTCLQGCGAVFKLSVVAGKWRSNLLHVFSGADGAFPTGAIAFDHAGNIYSTTEAGGSNSAGVVFVLTPKSAGGWKVHVLHMFDGKSGGLEPFAGVILDAKRNLYGTTAMGGNLNSACQGTSGCGVVYKMTPMSTGTWSFKVLHAFSPAEGYFVANPLAMDGAGTVFGTTMLGGGTLNDGTVFEINP